MSHHLRYEHLDEVLRAVLRYATRGHHFALKSDRTEGDLVIAIRLDDASTYDATLLELMEERAKTP